jgi:protein-tyrosine phosphatase
VPGVDDGARSLEDALDGVARMVDRGYARIVTTPHLEASLVRDREAFAHRMEQMDEAWDSVATAVRRRWPELDFRRGFEVRLDVADADLTEPRLRLGGTPFLLVEWAGMRAPAHGARLLAGLRSAGIRPIVAHPERYGGLDGDLRVVAEWREAGAYLQVNNGSLVDRYGARARAVALRLLERGWVDYLSTDFHGRAHLSLHAEGARARLMSFGGEEQHRLLARRNPGRLFDGEHPLPVPPLGSDAVRDFVAEG